MGVWAWGLGADDEGVGGRGRSAGRGAWAVGSSDLGGVAVQGVDAENRGWEGVDANAAGRGN